MNCKRCGAELENNARFCPTCGALQPMICPACGAESRPGSRECSACGRKLPLAERESKLVYTKRKKHTGAIIGTVIGVLCALLLLGGAVWLLLGSLPGEKAQTEQPEQVQQDVEGLMSMTNLGKNMAWLLRCIEAGKAAGIMPPEPDRGARTDFIR